MSLAAGRPSLRDLAKVMYKERVQQQKARIASGSSEGGGAGGLDSSTSSATFFFASSQKQQPSQEEEHTPSAVPQSHGLQQDHQQHRTSTAPPPLPTFSPVIAMAEQPRTEMFARASFSTFRNPHQQRRPNVVPTAASSIVLNRSYGELNRSVSPSESVTWLGGGKTSAKRRHPLSRSGIGSIHSPNISSPHHQHQNVGSAAQQLLGGFADPELVAQLEKQFEERLEAKRKEWEAAMDRETGILIERLGTAAAKLSKADSDVAALETVVKMKNRRISELEDRVAELLKERKELKMKVAAGLGRNTGEE